ncbi:hypothetical protein BH09PSE5_BH09PSE5_18220 [soil metagenome]
MATNQEFVDHIRSHSGLDDVLTYKKMFGEYALYFDGKVVAFAVDNQLFLKPTVEARALLKKVSEHPAYPGSKLYFRIDEELDDRLLLRRLLEVTFHALPAAKPKAARKSAGKVARKTASKTASKPTGKAAPARKAAAKRTARKTAAAKPGAKS